MIKMTSIQPLLMIGLFFFVGGICYAGAEVAGEKRESVQQEEDHEGELKKRPAIYQLLHIVGCILDPFFTRGTVSEKHQQMAKEVARSLGVDNRRIEVKNSGIFWRWWFGYAHCDGDNYGNRVYVNEDWLNELTEEEKKFVLAQSFVQHSQHHRTIRLLLYYLLLNVIGPQVNPHIVGNELWKKYLRSDGLEADNFWLNLFGWGFSHRNGVRSFNIYGLLLQQIQQYLEKETDIEAVTKAGCDPEHGVELLKKFYHPDTTNWPFYAKFQQAFISLRIAANRLPFFKWYSPFRTLHERTSLLKEVGIQ